MDKYDKCKKCGARAVHLVTSGHIEFYGDMDDNEGDESRYWDKQIDPQNTDIRLGAHICFECGTLEDVWIEETRGEMVVSGKEQVDL